VYDINNIALLNKTHIKKLGEDVRLTCQETLLESFGKITKGKSF
jgi:hypothetical protein